MTYLRSVRRPLVRLGFWTIAWTLFLWWAVIGWPETLEGSLAALVFASAISTTGLTAWHLWESMARRRLTSFGESMSALKRATAQIGSEAAGGSVLVIVARDAPLREYLARSSPESAHISVIVDRRYEERRRDASVHWPERRSGERRCQPAADSRLRPGGYLITRERQRPC